MDKTSPESGEYKQEFQKLWDNINDDGKKDVSEVELTAGNPDSSESRAFTKPLGTKLPLSEQYTWDVCFVFDVGSPDKIITVKDAESKQKIKIKQDEHFRNVLADHVTRFEEAGLKVDLWKSVQQDEVYVRVGCAEKRLQQEADRIDYDLQLDGQKCLEAASLLDIPLAMATEDDSVDDVDEGAWLHLYGKYDQFDPENPYRHELYKQYPDDELEIRNNSLFTSIDRIKLTVNVIEADHELGGAQVSMSKAIAHKDNPMLAFFPLHENKKKTALMKRWYRWQSAFKSPHDQIRAYFGEAIAMYFGFLGFYNRALMIPSALGVVLFVWQMIAGRVDVEGIPVYAMFISIWATLFLEFWKRKESKYRVRWGMTKFKEKEQPRPEFVGTYRPSPIDGHEIEYFPWQQKIKRALIAQGVIWTLIMVVIGSVIGVFVFRNILVRWNRTLGQYITAFINALQIQILNVIYGIVAHKLNDYENHRTDTEYENALIAKTFLFKFVNSYNSMFYIAFGKKYESDPDFGCPDNNCLTELRTQLGTIFITSIVINNFMELALPAFSNWRAERANRQKNTDANAESGEAFMKKSVAEQEYELQAYESTFEDFDELVIQYGYVTLFVVAFPLAPLCALANNILETRIDATKLCQLCRRPEPRGAYDIGTWSDILEIVSIFAVVVNVAIIAFETDLVEEWVHENEIKAYIFIAGEHFILLVKFAIAYFVPDEPKQISDHRARNEYLVNVLIRGVEDENPDDLIKGEALSKKVDFDWSRLSDKVKFTGREW